MQHRTYLGAISGDEDTLGRIDDEKMGLCFSTSLLSYLDGAAFVIEGDEHRGCHQENNRGKVKYYTIRISSQSIAFRGLLVFIIQPSRGYWLVE